MMHIYLRDDECCFFLSDKVSIWRKVSKNYSQLQKMQQQIKILLFTYLLLFKVNESKNFTGETQKSYIFIQRL